MDKRRRIKRSVVTCAVLVGLSVSPQAQAGWLSDRWNDLKDSITDVRDSFTKEMDRFKDRIKAEINRAGNDIGAEIERGAIKLLGLGDAGKGADYIIGALLNADKLGLDGHLVFKLLIDVMENDKIITDDILIAMMKNDNMISLIGKIINGADNNEEKQARATEFFNLSIERLLPIMMDPSFDINLINEIPTDAYVMFSNLGSIESNDDGLEKAWEGLLRNAMSDPQSAGGMFNILFQLSPEYQKVMMDYMFLAIDANGVQHVAQSVNFNQAMIEGFATMMASDPQATMALFQQLMPILMTFDSEGNMTGMTPYGMRFMTVLGTKMMKCEDPSATALGMAFGQMMPGIIPPAINEDYACNRVVDSEYIAYLNAGEITYMDSDEDGVPDFMDQYPGINNSIDTDNDGIPDGADSDIDGDGIDNDADSDIDGDGLIDNGPDTDNDGINDAHDTDIDGDGIDNEADADINGDGIMDNGPDTDGDGINDAHDTTDDTDTDNDGIIDGEDTDIDNDGIYNDADSDVNGDGVIDNGPDTDNDGINDANDPDIDNDGIANDADVDVDGDGVNDNGTDTDGDGINDAHDTTDDTDTDNDGIPDTEDSDIDGDGIPNEADVDVDGDGVNDNGIDTDGDGINNAHDTDDNAGRMIFGYNGVALVHEDGSTPASFTFDPNADIYVTISLGDGKSVVLNVPMAGYFTDDAGSIIMTSKKLLDDQTFIISMSQDGFGRVFIGNDDEGFEMTGDLNGLKSGEELIFSTREIDGVLTGSTTIKPKDKNLTFGSSILK